MERGRFYIQGYVDQLDEKYWGLHEYRLGINVGGFCQLRCVTCAGNDALRIGLRFGQIYDYDQFIHFLKQTLSRVNINGIVFTALPGEPTLDPKLISLIKITNRISTLPIRLNTNGLIENPQTYLRELKNAGLSNIAVSLNAVNADNYCRFSKRDIQGNFNKVLDTIKLAINIFGAEHSIVSFIDFGDPRISPELKKYSVTRQEAEELLLPMGVLPEKIIFREYLGRETQDDYGKDGRRKKRRKTYLSDQLEKEDPNNINNWSFRSLLDHYFKLNLDQDSILERLVIGSVTLRLPKTSGLIDEIRLTHDQINLIEASGPSLEDLVLKRFINLKEILISEKEKIEYKVEFGVPDLTAIEGVRNNYSFRNLEFANSILKGLFKGIDFEAACCGEISKEGSLLVNQSERVDLIETLREYYYWMQTFMNSELEISVRLRAYVNAAQYFAYRIGMNVVREDVFVAYNNFPVQRIISSVKKNYLLQPDEKQTSPIRLINPKNNNFDASKPNNIAKLLMGPAYRSSIFVTMGYLDVDPYKMVFEELLAKHPNFLSPLFAAGYLTDEEAERNKESTLIEEQLRYTNLGSVCLKFKQWVEKNGHALSVNLPLSDPGHPQQVLRPSRTYQECLKRSEENLTSQEKKVEAAVQTVVRLADGDIDPTHISLFQMLCLDIEFQAEKSKEQSAKEAISKWLDAARYLGLGKLIAAGRIRIVLPEPGPIKNTQTVLNYDPKPYLEALESEGIKEVCFKPAEIRGTYYSGLESSAGPMLDMEVLLANGKWMEIALFINLSDEWVDNAGNSVNPPSIHAIDEGLLNGCHLEKSVNPNRFSTAFGAERVAFAIACANNDNQYTNYEEFGLLSLPEFATITEVILNGMFSSIPFQLIDNVRKVTYLSIVAVHLAAEGNSPHEKNNVSNIFKKKVLIPLTREVQALLISIASNRDDFPAIKEIPLINSNPTLFWQKVFDKITEIYSQFNPGILNTGAKQEVIEYLAQKYLKVF